MRWRGSSVPTSAPRTLARMPPAPPAPRPPCPLSDAQARAPYENPLATNFMAGGQEMQFSQSSDAAGGGGGAGARSPPMV